MNAPGAWFVLFILASGVSLGADAVGGTGPTETELPSVVPSLVRVSGALALVLAIFFAAVWAVRNWRRWAPRSTGSAELRIVEVRSLGVRQSLVVVSYRRQRMLLAATASGITFLSHLPEVDLKVEGAVGEPVSDRTAASSVPAVPDFMGAFRDVLSRRA